MSANDYILGINQAINYMHDNIGRIILSFKAIRLSFHNITSYRCACKMFGK